MERTVDGQSVSPERFSGAVRYTRLDSTSLSALEAFERPRLAWADESTTIIAGGIATLLTATGPNRFSTVRENATALFDGLDIPESVPAIARPRLYGGFSFTDTHSDPGPDSTWHGFPGGWFLLPAAQITITPDGQWLTTIATGPEAAATAQQRLETHRESSPDRVSTQNPPGVVSKTFAPPRSDWQREIQETTASIKAGKLQKVVLAQALTAKLSRPVSVSAMLSRLGETYPSCFRFAFEPAQSGAFFGATPERLVSVNGGAVETEALAGSIGRGDTVDEDDWLATQLLESEKNSHEHEIVVETIRKQLDPLTESVQTGERRIKQLANVQHLETPISAELDGSRHVLDFVEALHPTPAVGGLPPDVALETIRETEVFERGWYAAPVGWIDADGNGTFAVAIRSAVAWGNQATLFAGAGIVADSDPNEEYDELQLKYRPILDELA